jgi:hypothetical protein
MSQVLREQASSVGSADVIKRTSHLADQEIRHLEKVLKATAFIDGQMSVRSLGASYWAIRANGIAQGYRLLAPQKARVAALAHKFAARAARAQAPAKPASPGLLAA